MRNPSMTRILAGAALLALLCGPQQASAQPAGASPRPIAAPARPAAAPVAAPAPRGGAACHNGMSFDRFLADLKQQAVAAGVSQRALAEAAPYLVYDQSIVNRDRGQRVFGQVFSEFAREQGVRWRGKKCASANPDACGGVQPRREGIWGAAGGDRRVLGTGEQFRRRIGQAALRCRRWCRWRMTAAAPRCSRRRPSPR